MTRSDHREGLPRGSPFSLVPALALALGLAAAPSAAWELDGRRTIALHAKDGTHVDIGHVDFTPRADGRADFAIVLDHAKFSDHFLSMREFKCLSGVGEILCHVPYPYRRPSTVSRDDLAWLEHALLFMFKLPGEFGAKLWNGVYFRLAAGERGLVGTPQAVDLNLIGAPPAKPDVPPYRPALRDDIREGARWFQRLTIE